MITSEVKELKVLQCDLNDSLSLSFCQQSLFPFFVSRDLQQHGGHYSQKTRDLLRELVFLSRLEQEIRLSSIVSVYGKLRDVFSKVRVGRSTEAYWMKLEESEELLECVNREIFCVLDEKTSETNDERESNESNELNEESSLSTLNKSKKTNTENDPNASKDSKDFKDSKDSKDSKAPKASNDSSDSKNPTKKEDWLQPPEKWVEVRRILSELNEAGSPSDRKCVLLSVLNMKVLTELHNFLLSPSFYCLLSMRRILNRAFEEKTLSSREKKLLAEVRRRLDGQLDPNWRANWLTFQRITELESDRTNSIELPRSSLAFLIPAALFPNLRVVLCSAANAGAFPNPFVRYKPNIVIVVDANLVPIRQAEVSDPFSLFFSSSTTKRRDPRCSISISSATKAQSSKTISQSSKSSPTDSKSFSKSAIA